MTNLSLQVLPRKTKQLFKEFQKTKPDFLNAFYLTGGTALSIYLKHRESEDLDFFTEKEFNPLSIQTKLKKYGSLKDLEIEENTLNTYIKSVKLQFLHYPYPMLKPLKNFNGVKISSLIDIACTKLQTIGMRGSKKDFIDLYFILKKYSIIKLFKKLDKKYPDTQFNRTHILKALTYFDDGEKQPMPRMHKKADWNKIKKTLSDKVKTIPLL